MKTIPPFVSTCIVLLASLIASEVSGQQAERGRARTSTTGLQLVGTSIGEAGALAIIQQADGRLHVLKPGHDLRGYTVAAIEPARVVLKRDEVEVALELQRSGRVGTPTDIAIEPSRIVLDGDGVEGALENPRIVRVYGSIAQLAAARQKLTETVGAIWQDLGGGEIWQEGNTLLIAGPSGMLEASVRIPEELVGNVVDIPR